MPQETRTASLPRKMKRAAGAASDNVNRGPAGKSKTLERRADLKRGVSH